MPTSTKLVGIRPTGKMHIGHLFSVIIPAKLFGCDVLIADLHAPDCTEQDLMDTVDTLKKFDVVHQTNFQSDVFDYVMFSQLLNIASLGHLERMTQYKSSTDKTLQMLLYPVRMAVDVADYEQIFIGEDQKQHIEYARDLLVKYNTKSRTCQKTLPVPTIFGGRIHSLRSVNKMSKSQPDGCIFLDDTPEEIEYKIRKAIQPTVEELCRYFHVQYKADNMVLTRACLSHAIITQLTTQEFKYGTENNETNLR